MKLRMQITKDRDIRFISHLEYIRTIERAIRRAQLPAAYSEGFNPHMKFSLASALGVGVVSYTEFVEIELYEDVDILEAAEALAKALPRGIRVLMADRVENHHAALMAQAAGARYRITLPYAGPIDEALAAFADRESLMFKKAAPKTREGFKEIDVKFYISELEAVSHGGKLVLSFTCKITPSGSMKAVDLLNALNGEYNLGLPVELADIERLSIFRLAKNGKRIGMLNTDAIKLG